MTKILLNFHQMMKTYGKVFSKTLINLLIEKFCIDFPIFLITTVWKFQSIKRASLKEIITTLFLNDFCWFVDKLIFLNEAMMIFTKSIWCNLSEFSFDENSPFSRFPRTLFMQTDILQCSDCNLNRIHLRLLLRLRLQ